VSMQIGYADPTQEKSFLDYPSLDDAERASAFMLRHDIRVLPNLFEVAVHEYASLASQEWFEPNEIDNFLCHDSSQKFSTVVERLITDAGLTIPKSRWYSKLSSRGNMGAVSIFIMIDDFVRKHDLHHGEKILCFVPESRRFTIACMLLGVVDPGQDAQATHSTRERSSANNSTPPSSTSYGPTDEEHSEHAIAPPNSRHSPVYTPMFCVSLRTYGTAIAREHGGHRSCTEFSMAHSSVQTTCLGWRVGFHKFAKAHSGCATPRPT
jgi:hypothetical protein